MVDERIRWGKYPVRRQLLKYHLECKGELPRFLLARDMPKDWRSIEGLVTRKAGVEENPGVIAELSESRPAWICPKGDCVALCSLAGSGVGWARCVAQG